MRMGSSTTSGGLRETDHAIATKTYSGMTRLENAEKVGKPVVNLWDGWLELFIKKYGLAPDMIRQGYV
jgi:hypothetical protein